LREIPHSELKLLQKVASGNFGEVWKGSFENKDVAIKIPKAQENVNFQEITNEALLMGMVGTHENIVNIIGISMVKPSILVVIEWVDGGDLVNLIQKNKFGRVELLRFSRMIANGMSALHVTGIIHRDLACRNVMVKRDESSGEIILKITDFGLSRLNMKHQMEIKDSTLVPLLWTAPEGLTGQFHFASDVWSWGCTVVEMFCGTPYPQYAELSHMEIAGKVLNEGVRPKAPPGAPDNLSMLLLQCWSRDYNERPSFEVILQVLDPLLAKLKV